MSRKIFVLLLAFAMILAMSVVCFAQSEAMCTYCHGAGCSECDGVGTVYSDSNMAFTFFALLPPIFAIGLALITKEVYSSLFLGIVLGALLYANFNPLTALNTLISDALISAVMDNAGIYIFLVFLGITVVLLNKSGGTKAFGRWAEKNIKTRVGAIIATAILGMLIFVDDYFNCLTVGSVMKPITDRHKVSRAKLAYLIDSTAAPICMIAPISSWAAAVTGVVEGDEGIALFLSSIPWNYYSLLTFVFIFAMAILKFDFGPMKLHEMNAILNDDLYTTADRVDTSLDNIKQSDKGKVIDLILPIIVLIASCFVGLLDKGDFWNPESEYFGNLAMAFGNTDVYLALTWGSCVSLLFTIIYFLARKVINFEETMKSIPEGFINMVPAIIILVLANGLKTIVNTNLGAKYFIGNLMDSVAGSLFSFLPAVIFLVGCILSFSTGTSWGTFGILIPIVSVMFDPSSKLFYIAIAACLAGAVFGDHCSPISDTTIMASAGAMCNHVNHVQTQIPYAVTVGIICFVNYIIAGFVQNVVLCLIIGIVLTVGTVLVIKAIESKKEEKKA